jgi:hypothetical protein
MKGEGGSVEEGCGKRNSGAHANGRVRKRRQGREKERWRNNKEI